MKFSMKEFSPIVPAAIITCGMLRNIWDLQPHVANHTKIYPKGPTSRKENQWGGEYIYMIPNVDLILDLIAVQTSPRNVILIDQSGICWSSTSKVANQVSPFHPPPQRKKRQFV